VWCGSVGVWCGSVGVWCGSVGMWEYGSMGVVAGMRIEEGWQSEGIYENKMTLLGVIYWSIIFLRGQ